MIYQIKSRKPTYIKPYTVQTLQVPLKSSKALLFKTENLEPFFAEIPYTQILSKLKRYFPVMELLSKTSEKPCPVISNKKSLHVHTLPTGIIGYFEIPITSVKPTHDRKNDLNTMVL